MRELTSEERDDARRLKQLWIAKKDELHLSQVKAAKEQGCVWSIAHLRSRYLSVLTCVVITTLQKYTY